MLKFEVLPKITFILFSSTLKLLGYDLQNVPTSTGRADMIIRVIKNALYLPNGYNSEMGVIIFPNRDFLSNLSKKLGNEDYTKKGFLITSKAPYFFKQAFKIASEHELLESFYNSFLNIAENTMFYCSTSMNLYESMALFIQWGIPIFYLHEEGELIKNVGLFSKKKYNKMCFLIGDQIGFSEIDLQALPKEMTPISLGKTSYLGSTTVSLIKWIAWQNSFLANNP
jgi:tRNA pseudouridine-54 N-methylase